MNWDDLRIIAALCDQGSYAKAGHALALDQTTIARRLARIQQDLGQTLFDIVDGQRRPTAFCLSLLGPIRQIQRHVQQIDCLAQQSPQAPTRVRLTATPGIAEQILAPRLADFLADHPGLCLEIHTGSENLSLDRWQADLALRLRRPQRGQMMMQKLADIPLYLVQGNGGGAPLLCLYPEDLADLPESRYLQELSLPVAPRCVSANGRILRAVLASGRGIGVLPAYMLGAENGFDPLHDPRIRVQRLPVSRELWLLSHNPGAEQPAIEATKIWLRTIFAEAFD